MLLIELHFCFRFELKMMFGTWGVTPAPVPLFERGY